MIVITGGAGFIGSGLAAALNERGRNDLFIVDELGCDDKWKNLRNLDFEDYWDKDQLFSELKKAPSRISGIFHMGACSSTTEKDASFLMNNNTQFTLELARMSVEHRWRMVYASSAATYGDGLQGYNDLEENLSDLQPMNMYGYSKHLADLQMLRRGWLKHLAGVKFFNVFGPNEYHKAGMVSVVYQAFCQIREHGQVKLFKSHRSDYSDGGQLRDFVYVKDAVNFCLWLFDHPEVNGVFNCGTGQARSFKDLALSVYKAMDQEPEIEYIDMPEQLRDRYQYYTQADMSKARSMGYQQTPYSLEDSVRDYVVEYLSKEFKHW